MPQPWKAPPGVGRLSWLLFLGGFRLAMTSMGWVACEVECKRAQIAETLAEACEVARRG